MELVIRDGYEVFKQAADEAGESILYYQVNALVNLYVLEDLAIEAQCTQGSQSAISEKLETLTYSYQLSQRINAGNLNEASIYFQLGKFYIYRACQLLVLQPNPSEADWQSFLTHSFLGLEYVRGPIYRQTGNNMYELQRAFQKIKNAMAKLSDLSKDVFCKQVKTLEESHDCKNSVLRELFVGQINCD